MKFRKLPWLALVATLSHTAYASDVDYALISAGASFVSASSEIFGPNATMQNNLLGYTRMPWLSNGDSSFMFGYGDPSQSITINLGSLRDMSSIGAEIELVDRPVNINTFSVEVSIDGTNWTNWEGTQTFTPNVESGNDLLAISGVTQNIEYIQYIFGPSPGTGAQGFTGSRVIQLYTGEFSAQSVVYPTSPVVPPVPVPAAIWLFATSLLGLQVFKRRKK